MGLYNRLSCPFWIKKTHRINHLVKPFNNNRCLEHRNSKIMKIFYSLSIAALVWVVLFPQPAKAQNKANDIVGYWLSQDADAKIEITSRGGRYFGKLVWLKSPIDTETKKPKLDKHNPTASLKNRPLLNLEILTNFTFDGDDEWNGGKIYDPKTGKTYSCLMQFESDKKLKIKGYIGVSWIGKTTIWSRTTAP